MVFLVLAVVILVVLVFLLATTNPWLPVSQTVSIPNIGARALEDPMFLLLSNVRGAEVQRTHPGTFALLVRRSPAWIWPPLVITFPLGLLFLMVKQTGSLQVTLEDDGAGTQVRMVGKTKKTVVKTLATALGSLGA